MVWTRALFVPVQEPVRKRHDGPLLPKNHQGLSQGLLHIFCIDDLASGDLVNVDEALSFKEDEHHQLGPSTTLNLGLLLGLADPFSSTALTATVFWFSRSVEGDCRSSDYHLVRSRKLPLNSMHSLLFLGCWQQLGDPVGGLFNNGHIISEDGLNISKRKGMHIGKLTDSYPLVLLNGGSDRNHYSTSLSRLFSIWVALIIGSFFSLSQLWWSSLSGLLTRSFVNLCHIHQWFFSALARALTKFFASIRVQTGWGSGE